MTIVPEMDVQITDIIVGKIAVIYKPNERGEFPNSFNKAFIPSSISIDTEWYVGYTPYIISGFSMYEISDAILHGLQQFDIINGDFKKYDKFGRMNPDEVKLEIVLTPEELSAQLVAKALVMQYIVSDVYAKKMNLLQAPYSLEEQSTWDLQYNEAKAYLADQTAIVPFIASIATTRGIDLYVLASSIVGNGDAYRLQLSLLLGAKQLYADRIKASLTNAELNTLLLEINSL